MSIKGFAMRARISCVVLVAILCTAAANAMVNAEIDKATVETGRAIVTGKIDASHDLVVRVDRGDKPIEWRSSRTGGGEFEVVVEASDKIRLDGGKTGHGFVVTTKILTSSDVTYVPCGGDLAGTFAIRPQADFETKEGVLTFADITLKDGKKLPVSLRLALSRDAVPVPAGTADKLTDDNATLDAARHDIDRLQGTWRVVSSQVADEKAAEDEVARRSVTIKGDLLIYEHGNEQKEKKEGTIKLDPKTWAIDWNVTSHGVTLLAIYKLNGDELKIGFGNDSLIQVRPTRFVMGKDDVVWLLVLKRNAKDIAPVEKEKAAEDKAVE
jgi:uncharacterized protein (TIGR03067 family)